MKIPAVASLCLVLLCFCDGENILNQKDPIKYNDCDDVFRSGRYKESGSYLLFLNTSKPLEVYCRFEPLNASSAVIMQQKYGRISFVRHWEDYVHGFGSLISGDYWMGLAGMKALTDSGYHVLTITLQDWAYRTKVLRYNYFFLGSPSQRYQLHIGGYVSSSILADDFGHNNGMPFATIDRPDAHNCAIHQKAGWWYNYCTYTLPTGFRYNGGHYTPSGGFYDGIYYKDWLGYGYSLMYIKMELSRY